MAGEPRQYEERNDSGAHRRGNNRDTLCELEPIVERFLAARVRVHALERLLCVRL